MLQDVFNTGHAAASAIGSMSATGLIIYIVGLVFLKVLNGIRSHKCCINCIKLFAAAEILMFCQVLALLPMINTIRGRYFALLTPELFATVRSSTSHEFHDSKKHLTFLLEQVEGN